jgi:hypothetical protein
MPGVLTDEHRRLPPCCPKGANIVTAVDEPLLVEQPVCREKDLAMHVTDDGRLGAERDAQSAVEQRVLEHLVKANYDIERAGRAYRAGVHPRQIIGQRASAHGEVANAPLDEVARQRGFREMDEVGARLERIDLREDAAKSLQVRRILAFARLELDDRNVDRWRHRRKHATRRGHRQPSCGYILQWPPAIRRLEITASTPATVPNSRKPCRS